MDVFLSIKGQQSKNGLRLEQLESLEEQELGHDAPPPPEGVILQKEDAKYSEQ